MWPAANKLKINFSKAHYSLLHHSKYLCLMASSAFLFVPLALMQACCQMGEKMALFLKVDNSWAQDMIMENKYFGTKFPDLRFAFCGYLTIAITFNFFQVTRKNNFWKPENSVPFKKILHWKNFCFSEHAIVQRHNQWSVLSSERVAWMQC